MLFNFDWLKESQIFPPKAEIVRLKKYNDYARLFDNNISLVLKPYIDRLDEIIGRLKETDKVNPSFKHMPNFFRLSTIKTVDLMVGDEPTIKHEDKQEEIDEALLNTDFFSKLDDLVADNDALGECIVRPFIDSEGQRNFVAQNPSMWFPIVNPENYKEVKFDVLVWTVCTYQDANNPARNTYELYAKIQERGKDQFEFRRYKINKHYTESYTDPITETTCGPIQFYVIGGLLESKIETAPYTQLVIQIPGITSSRTIHGLSNYDTTLPIVAEIAVRESLANFILDQNSAPRMGAPESAFIRNKDGRWVLKSGGRSFVVAPGEQAPVYITWDGNLTSNEDRIRELKKELYAMCEMGTIISHDDMNSSQGYEALEVKLTNPKLKVQRMCKKFKAPLKKLIAYLVDEPDLEDKDISILFNNGIPTSESQNLDMAQKKKNLGFSSQSVFTEYFGLTEEQAKEEVEKARQESADAFAESFGMSRNSLFGGGNGDDKPTDQDGAENPTEEEDAGETEKMKQSKNDKSEE